MEKRGWRGVPFGRRGRRLADADGAPRGGAMAARLVFSSAPTPHSAPSPHTQKNHANTSANAPQLNSRANSPHRAPHARRAALAFTRPKKKKREPP